jgi:hypothetical protein
VASAGGEARGLVVAVHGVLSQADGGAGLEGDAQLDGPAVADAALDSARSVRRGAQPAARPRDEGVVVLDARHARAGEAAADLEALRGGQGEQVLRELGLELVEHRPADATP